MEHKPSGEARDFLPRKNCPQAFDSLESTWISNYGSSIILPGWCLSPISLTWNSFTCICNSLGWNINHLEKPGTFCLVKTVLRLLIHWRVPVPWPWNLNSTKLRVHSSLGLVNLLSTFSVRCQAEVPPKDQFCDDPKNGLKGVWSLIFWHEPLFNAKHQPPPIRKFFHKKDTILNPLHPYSSM